MSLAFILGREPHLSVAELFAVLGDAVRWEEAEVSAEVMVVPMHDVGAARRGRPSGQAGTVPRPYAEHSDVAHTFMSRLAGTVKIAEVASLPVSFRGAAPRNLTRDNNEAGEISRIADSLEMTLRRAIAQRIITNTTPDRRTRYGFSVYDVGGGAKEVARVRKILQRSAKDLKAQLEAQGRKVRHVTSREATLSSVTVERQGLLPEDNGVEVCVLVGTDRVTLTRTLAVQPFQEWSKRDYGRPRRDARSGMLPPKLARTMINIGLQSTISVKGGFASGEENQKSKILLDPFCGSGTVLTEAMLVGVSSVIGTDISETAVRDAQENMEWVRTHSSPSGAKRSRGAVGSTSRVTISQCDVRQLSRGVREQVHVIVTEPYLGPPLSSAVGAGPRPRPSGGQPRGVAPTQHAIDDVVRELRALYVDAFRAFATVLSPGGRVVFVVPDYRLPTTDYRQPLSLDITADVAPLGFHRVNPFPPALRDHSVLRGRDDLPYARADQRVGRRVLLFTYQP